MRDETITWTLYSYDELSDTAKDHALERLWDINVDYNWYESITDDIGAFGDASWLGCRWGKEFNLDKGRYCNIDNIGCTFSEIYRQWEPAREQFPDVAEAVLDPFFKEFTAREIRQLLQLERSGLLGQLSGETSTSRRSARTDVDINDYPPESQRHKRICALLTQLESAWGDLVNNLEYYYVNLLQKEYDYQTDRAQIEESIRANEYEFYENGNLA